MPVRDLDWKGLSPSWPQFSPTCHWDLGDRSSSIDEVDVPGRPSAALGPRSSTRVQGVIATGSNIWPSNASAGVRHPKVLRGPPLSVAAAASSSLPLYLFISAPQRTYWRSKPFVFSLELAATDSWDRKVNCQSRFNSQLQMLGHLRILVPCQRLSHVIWQCRNLLCDGLTRRLGTITGQGRSIVDTSTCCMPDHRREVRQHRESCCASTSVTIAGLFSLIIRSPSQ